MEKNAGEWAGKVEITKEDILGSRRSMHGYILTCSFVALGAQEIGLLFLRPQFSTAGA